jgi:hypothetical protein
MTMGALAVEDEVRPSLWRTFDTDTLNSLANHPDIRPTSGGDGRSRLDFTAFLKNDKNHALAWKHGVFLFLWTAPQTYEAHIMVLRRGRGKLAYRMARAAISYMVAEGAERLWARVNNDALRHYTAQAGFVRCGSDSLDYGFGPVAYDLYQWKKPCLQ